jgi:hypothetical protein
MNRTPNSPATPATDILQVLADMYGGVFVNQLSFAFSEVSLNTVATGDEGSVTITLKTKRIGETNQINVTHTLVAKVPTESGDRSERIIKETPMHVAGNGCVTLLPNTQTRLELGAGAATGRADAHRTPHERTNHD